MQPRRPSLTKPFRKLSPPLKKIRTLKQRIADARRRALTSRTAKAASVAAKVEPEAPQTAVALARLYGASPGRLGSKLVAGHLAAKRQRVFKEVLVEFLCALGHCTLGLPAMESVDCRCGRVARRKRPVASPNLDFYPAKAPHLVRSMGQKASTVTWHTFRSRESSSSWS